MKNKILLLLMIILQFTFGCSGDCLSCHPALAKNILTDQRHKPMLTCKQCHKNEEAGMSACGKDCFSCHNIEKIDKNVKEHAVIEGCRNCHMNIPVSLEIQPQKSSDSSSMYDLLLSPK